MASLTLTVTTVHQINGIVYVRWSDGVEQEFRSLQEARDLRDSLAQDRDVLRKMAIARYLRIDPNGTNPSLIEGHSLTYNDAINQMVVVV